MSSFTDPLVLVALASERGGRGEFELYLPFSYDIGFLGSGETITVPAGFDPDLASIPWFARAFVPIAGRMVDGKLIDMPEHAHSQRCNSAVHGIRTPPRGEL